MYTYIPNDITQVNIWRRSLFWSLCDIWCLKMSDVIWKSAEKRDLTAPTFEWTLPVLSKDMNSSFSIILTVSLSEAYANERHDEKHDAR